MRRVHRPAPTPCRTSVRTRCAPATSNSLLGRTRNGAIDPFAEARPRRWAGAILALALPWLLGPGQPAGAASVYKTVDPDGRVTYSARPPPDEGKRVEQIKIQGSEPDVPTAPPESESARQQSRASAVAAAQRELFRTKAALEQAKIQSAEDWQEQTPGKRVLSAAYFKRVTAAAAEVESAQRALDQARGAP